MPTMPPHRARCSSFCSSFKSLFKKLQASARGTGDPGTRSVTVTCTKFESSTPAQTRIGSALPPSDLVSKKQPFERHENVVVHMTDHVSLLPTAPNSSLTKAEPEHKGSSATVASCISQQEVCPSAEAPGTDPSDTFNQYDIQQPPSGAGSLHDMLCSIKPTVVSSDVVDEDSGGFTKRDNDMLREYYAVRLNVVLTSTCPEVAPHIVITPPYETPDDYYTPWLNRVDYHSNSNLLAIPPFDPSRLARMPFLDEQCYWPVAPTQISMNHGIPRHVFCRSRFIQLMRETESERLTMYDLMPALQRHRIKALAIKTSELAKIWKERHNDAGYLESVEKPYQWTDPAEPLLKCASQPGVVIFDSPNPFSVPHIMIWTPPAQDPWIPFSTATNDPQDSGFGRYLMVPAPMVSFINISSPRRSNLESIDDDFEVSNPATPEPSTPIDLGDDLHSSQWGRPLMGIYEDEDEDVLSCSSRGIATPYQNLGCHGLGLQNKTDGATSCRKPIFFVDDDEDDDLPPLDDWYLSVASRNGIQLSC